MCTASNQELVKIFRIKKSDSDTLMALKVSVCRGKKDYSGHDPGARIHGWSAAKSPGDQF